MKNNSVVSGCVICLACVGLIVVCIIDVQHGNISQAMESIGIALILALKLQEITESL